MLNAHERPVYAEVMCNVPPGMSKLAKPAPSECELPSENEVPVSRLKVSKSRTKPPPMDGTPVPFCRSISADGFGEPSESSVMVGPFVQEIATTFVFAV